MAFPSEDKALIQLLCDLEIPEGIKFSPDGQKLIYATNLNWGHKKGKHVVQSLWLATPGMENSSRRLTSGEFCDRAPAWHPDGESIVFISDRAEAGLKWALYTMKPSNDDQPRAITPTHQEQKILSFAFSPDGKHVAYISADEKTPEQRALVDAGEDFDVYGESWAFARLRIIDLATQTIKTVSLERDVHELCWNPKGREVGIVTSATPDQEDRWLNGTVISVIDAETAAVVRDLCVIPGPAEKIAWSNNGRIYFKGNVPLMTWACGNGLYSVDVNANLGEYKWTKFGYDEDVYDLIAVNGTLVAYLECGLDTKLSTLDDDILFDEGVTVESFSVFFAEQHGHILAVAKSDINNPVEVFTRKAGDTRMIQVSNHGEVFKSRTFGTCDYLSFPSSDNAAQIGGIYLTPATVGQQASGSTRKPLPTVVLIHGGPNTRHTNSFHAYYFYWANLLLAGGYGVLIPHYRGSSGGGKNFAFPLGGQIGKFDYEDIITATQYAITEGYADKDKLVAGGYSWGGFMTFCCATRNGLHGYGWKFRACIIGGGVGDTDSCALTGDLGAVIGPGYCEGRVPWTMDPDDIRNRHPASPLWEVKRAVETAKRNSEMIIPPVLIIHGQEDTRVHVSQATGMRRAFLRYKLPFECAIYPRQGHIIEEQKACIDLALRTKRWCDKYIGGAAISV